MVEEFGGRERTSDLFRRNVTCLRAVGEVSVAIFNAKRTAAVEVELIKLECLANEEWEFGRFSNCH